MFSAPDSDDEKAYRHAAVLLLRQTVALRQGCDTSPMDILNERIASGDTAAAALKTKIEAFRTDFAKLGPQKPATVSRGTVIRAVSIVRKA